MFPGRWRSRSKWSCNVPTRNGVAVLIRDRRPTRQAYEVIAAAGHDGVEAHFLQVGFEAGRGIQAEMLLIHLARLGAFVMAAVTRVDHDRPEVFRLRRGTGEKADRREGEKSFKESFHEKGGFASSAQIFNKTKINVKSFYRKSCGRCEAQFGRSEALRALLRAASTAAGS